MKQRKTFITLVLVLAVVGLAVAYAAAQDFLTISGTATAATDDSKFVVKFADGQETVTGTNATGKVTAPETAEITVTGLKAAEETATIQFTVQNASTELGANITAAVESTNNLFTVTTDVEDDWIAKGDSTTVTVNVKLNNAVATVPEPETITVKVTGTATNPTL